MNSQKTKNISSNYYIAAFIMAVLVIAVVIASFAVYGTPFDLRDRNADNKRISDFQMISGSVNSYYYGNSQLPRSLNDLTNITSYSKDPDTKQSYTYQLVSFNSYKLCATFSTEQLKDDNNISYPYPAKDMTAPAPAATSSSGSADSAIYPAPVSQSYKHKKGFDCITFTVNDYSKPVSSSSI